MTGVLALLLLVAGCGGDGPAPPEPVVVPGGVDAADPVLGWFDVTTAAVDALDSPVQSPRSALWATAWGAGDRAVSAAATPGSPGSPGAGAVAFARAVHDVLVDRVPAVQEAADAQLEATLAATEAGPDRDRAVDLGAAAAAEVLAERSDDGLGADAVAAGAESFRPRGGAGSWVLTDVDSTPSQSALGRATPFLVAPDEVDVPSPLELGTPAYREDLAKVRALGGRTGSDRTAGQTATASFWADDSLGSYTQVLRGLLERDPGRPLAQRVHLVAVFHQVSTDAQIACFAAKYDVQFWRPVTAVREAAPDGYPIPDGDPRTVPDPAWEPLLETPSHPEFPSAHTVFAGAAEVVLDALAGPPSEPVRIDVDGVGTRAYTDWTDLVEENVDARVWSGIHYRTSDEAGATLGRGVARLALDRLGD
ncbi:vanadium-dependent haloperoxidase [uncultured Nocardioides sp.]|uniref:vanadium-dependent haloperoxidase n=1 Tax=uncultured Nocardioides sp. TaxID=198441 RepID=UPI002637F45C|nr:vanadium-dependent haloperoxidase [uncultured Nocardioides sp.]